VQSKRANLATAMKRGHDFTGSTNPCLQEAQHAEQSAAKRHVVIHLFAYHYCNWSTF